MNDWKLIDSDSVEIGWLRHCRPGRYGTFEGEFEPCVGYGKYEACFTALERAANEMQLSEIDQIEGHIASLGLHVQPIGGRSKSQTVVDLQIMEGHCSFRLLRSQSDSDTSADPHRQPRSAKPPLSD